VVEDHTMQTSIPGVYAGGDIVSGAATVILAMGQAKIASRAIDHYLRTGRNPDPPPPPEEKKKKTEKAATAAKPEKTAKPEKAAKTEKPEKAEKPAKTA
jgi:pyruvate/2-oxoglutarate dehydrogenase complex dihydrolipoamide dehydrogenase (E3) component